eukprot:5621530-Amphidinium_carterae.1
MATMNKLLHLYVAAMVLPGLRNHEEVKVDSSIRTRHAAVSQSQLISGEVEDLSNQAYVPRQLRQPHQPTAMEIAEHRLTQMPYRSWCAKGVKAKGQPNHPRKGALKEQSFIQLDYAYIKSTSGSKVNTVLTGVETITGLHPRRFVVENGFVGPILQVDDEPAILALAQSAAKELTIPWRTSAPYEHQSQGAIERFHGTLFAQVPAMRFDLVDRYDLGILGRPDNVPEKLLPWILQHSCFTINRYLVYSDGLTKC